MDNELLKKAKEAKSVEELLSIAKENDFEMSKEEAQAYFTQLHQSGELSDEELDNVAGGGCYGKDGRLILSIGATGYNCKHWQCKSCGHRKITTIGTCFKCGGSVFCRDCKYFTYERGLWLCTNENTRRWG